MLNLSIIHPGALRRRRKRRAAWRVLNDALPPFSVSFFDHAGELCVRFACLCKNLHPTSRDRTTPTRSISSHSAAALGFYQLLSHFPGLPALIVTRIAFTRFTRSPRNTCKRCFFTHAISLLLSWLDTHPGWGGSKCWLLGPISM